MLAFIDIYIYIINTINVSIVQDTVMSTEIGKGNTFLRFSIVWSAGPPKARSEDTFTTGLDFLKLRNGNLVYLTERV